MFEPHSMSPAMLSVITEGEMDETDKDYVVNSVREINMMQDEEMWFVIGSSATTVELLGCPSEKGLLKIAYLMRVFIMTRPHIMIKAIIQNPMDLPYEISPAKSVMVIFGDHTLKIFHSIQKTVEFIEETLVKYDQSTIEDFAVLIGDEAEFDDKEWKSLELNGETVYGLC